MTRFGFSNFQTVTHAGCRGAALHLTALQIGGTCAALPLDTGGLLMALKCGDSTQEGSSSSHCTPTHCLSAAATAWGSGELHHSPALNSPDTFQQTTASLALDSSSGLTQALPVVPTAPQLAHETRLCLERNVYRGLGCMDGSVQNVLGGTARYRVIGLSFRALSHEAFGRQGPMCSLCLK